MSSPLHHVYLIPGFFGFANLGDLQYFAHVCQVLAAAVEARGWRAALHIVPSRPTASLRWRAARLAEAITETAGPDDPVHLIGHSSGGLDARLLLAPGVELPTSVDVLAAARRVRSVVAVATPHQGTPLASLFASVSGHRLLWLLSLASVYVLQYGRLPLTAALRLLRILLRLRRGVWPSETVLDQLFQQLLGDLSADRAAALEGFLSDVGRDQALLTQITPEAAELLSATLHHPRRVRAGSVVVRSWPLRLGTFAEVGLDAYGQTMHAIYRWLHTTTASATRGLAEPADERQQAALLLAYGEQPPVRANDGVVPTRSQVWGEVVAAVWADHLDVIGHFDHRDHTPPHFDWFPSGSHFDRWQFDALWGRVADFLVGEPGDDG